MKIIDLLNKIANGEEVPEYVQYYNMLQDKLDTMMVCKENIYYKLSNLEIQINSRVEPVEEEKKIPEKLNKQHFHNRQRQLANKINKIIDYLDYIKSKGE
jgi:hypothetical protein